MNNETLLLLQLILSVGRASLGVKMSHSGSIARFRRGVDDRQIHLLFLSLDKLKKTRFIYVCVRWRVCMNAFACMCVSAGERQQFANQTVLADLRLFFPNKDIHVCNSIDLVATPAKETFVLASSSMDTKLFFVQC